MRLRLPLLLALAATIAACDPAPKEDSSVPTSDTPTATQQPTASQPTAEPSASAAPTGSVAPQDPPPKVDAPAADEAKKYAKASNGFGLAMYQKVRAEKGNLAMSPASISTALAMTWAGAKGATSSQMKTTLQFEGTPEETAALAGKVIGSLQDPKNAVKLKVANRLFGEKTYTFEAPYLDLTKKSFGAGLEAVDYKTDFEGSRTKINAWAEQQTEKRIVNLIPAGAIDKDTRLTLVNAIYFLGDWADQFEKTATHNEDFQLGKGQKKNVPMMHSNKRFKYAEKNGVKALELSYQGGSQSMLFLLPKDADSMAAFEQGLSVKQIDELTAALATKKVEVSLPKFEVNPAESISLKKVLMAMGMTDAFDQKKADFTAMANPPKPDDRLYVGSVFHKAFVKVDEKGTEAAAATAVVMPKVTSAEMPEKMEVFKADHPFVFVLRDNTSGLILFIGRVTDPSAR